MTAFKRRFDSTYMLQQRRLRQGQERAKLRRRQPRSDNERLRCFCARLSPFSQIYRIVAHKFRNEITGKRKVLEYARCHRHRCATHIRRAYRDVWVLRRSILTYLWGSVRRERKPSSEHRTKQIEIQVSLVIALASTDQVFRFYFSIWTARASERACERAHKFSVSHTMAVIVVVVCTLLNNFATIMHCRLPGLPRC